MVVEEGFNETGIGIFPNDWVISELEMISEVIDPHPSHRAPSIDINGIPFLGIGDMNENGKIINENSRKVSPFVYEEHAKRYNLNDKLIGLGRVA
jgi:type I restriction enzyme S subunit